MKSKVTVAFYKGKGTWVNGLIRWWTKSEYSHVELIVDGVWYTSATWEKGTVARALKGNPEKWDMVELPCTVEQKVNATVSARNKLGKGYDYWGILFSQVLPWKGDRSDRWFCSEYLYSCLADAGIVAGLVKPEEVSPQNLSDMVVESVRDEE